MNTQELVPDQNKIAYTAYLGDSGWFKDHEGEVVAFVAGRFIGSFTNEDEATQTVLSQYPDKGAYIARVVQEPTLAQLFDSTQLSPEYATSTVEIFQAIHIILSSTEFSDEAKIEFLTTIASDAIEFVEDQRRLRD